MLLGLSYLRLISFGAVAIALWFTYGWGHQIIRNYTEMPMQIERLTKQKVNLEARVNSYQTLMARRDAAIEASQCRVQIQHWVKNPDEIPTKFDPFNQLR